MLGYISGESSCCILRSRVVVSVGAVWVLWLYGAECAALSNKNQQESTSKRDSWILARDNSNKSVPEYIMFTLLLYFWYPRTPHIGSGPIKKDSTSHSGAASEPAKYPADSAALHVAFPRAWQEVERASQTWRDFESTVAILGSLYHPVESYLTPWRPGNSLISHIWPAPRPITGVCGWYSPETRLNQQPPPNRVIHDVLVDTYRQRLIRTSPYTARTPDRVEYLVAQSYPTSLRRLIKAALPVAFAVRSSRLRPPPFLGSNSFAHSKRVISSAPSPRVHGV